MLIIITYVAVRTRTRSVIMSKVGVVSNASAYIIQICHHNNGTSRAPVQVDIV